MTHHYRNYVYVTSMTVFLPWRRRSRKARAQGSCELLWCCTDYSHQCRWYHRGVVNTDSNLAGFFVSVRDQIQVHGWGVLVTVLLSVLSSIRYLILCRKCKAKAKVLLIVLLLERKYLENIKYHFSILLAE